ncbi:MAG TPA: prolyl oligopeptidase family serine peptidase [Opitutaceae bacterium]|nr:prolyl oligopeptidase family serine peptidase [Opitutaceae bacterium]
MDSVGLQPLGVGRLLLWMLLCGWASLSLLGQETPKVLPLAGETFKIGPWEAFIISPVPTTVTEGGTRPWVWYAPTLPGLPDKEERVMFEQWTQTGIAIAGIDVGESFGSPRGRAGFTALYKEMTEKRGYSQRPIFLARSRGGLMALNWAVENPEKVAAIAAIYPVSNLRSYPGLVKASVGYEMTPQQLEAVLATHNPIERLEPLAKARVPLFVIHGDVDTLVPLEDNSGILRARYEALGGPIRLVIPAGQGHNRWSGFFQNSALIEFVKEQTKP